MSENIIYKEANFIQRQWIIFKYIVWHWLRKSFVGNVSAKKVENRFNERYYNAEVNFENF
jgi:hypothetical protein